MKFPPIDHPITGVAVPVSSLKSESSCGIGEFLDLMTLGGLCKKCGIDLIQILPVQDTGFNPSPYSALSAFALHPVYLRLQSLPGADRFSSEISRLRGSLEAGEKVDFNAVLEGKREICKSIYDQSIGAIKKDKLFHSWIEENPWVRIYSVYKHLKEKNGRKHWKEWKTLQNPTEDDIRDVWEREGAEASFYAWMQFHCAKQLRQSADTLESIQIGLKGDIPILMNEDSADVWMHRDLFNPQFRAGAPPDMYSDEGQNWDFPLYDWQAMEKDGYSWWKRRLAQASKFFHAYRIDHVLGFFRIWAIPDYEETADMGFYVPYNYVTEEELMKAGFPAERIAWLSKAHIYTGEISGLLPDQPDLVLPYLKRIGNEDLFLFREELRGTADIARLDLPDHVKEIMKQWEKNRTLLKTPDGKFFPAWHFVRNRGFQSLSGEERHSLDTLLEKKRKSSEKKWEDRGHKLLSTLQSGSDMLVCAEDLGVVPECVPRVLSKLKIYSLRVAFWGRKYNEPGQPFIPVGEYPEFCVATLSVHDSQIFRQWWDRDSDRETRGEFCKALGIDDISRKSYSPSTALKIMDGFLSTSARMAILQIQEYFDLVEELRQDPDEARVNIPGTVNEKNWTYRIPIPLEELMQQEDLCSVIQKLTMKRRRKRDR